MHCTCGSGKVGCVRYQGTEYYLCSDCLTEEGKKKVKKFIDEIGAILHSSIRGGKFDLMPFPKPKPEWLIQLYVAWKHWHYSINPAPFNWPEEEPIIKFYPKEPKCSLSSWTAIASWCPGLGRTHRYLRNSPTLRFDPTPEPEYFLYLERLNNAARQGWVKFQSKKGEVETFDFSREDTEERPVPRNKQEWAKHTDIFNVGYKNNEDRLKGDLRVNFKDPETIILFAESSPDSKEISRRRRKIAIGHSSRERCEAGRFFHRVYSMSLCPDCKGIVRYDKRGERVCESCGLVLVDIPNFSHDEERVTPGASGYTTFDRSRPRKTPATIPCEYRLIKNEIIKKEEIRKFEHPTHDHEPSVKQKLKSSSVDRRVENIVLERSLDNSNKIAESIGNDRYMMDIPNLLTSYNTDLMNYTPITDDQLRDSFNKRLLRRYVAKIEQLIQKMLFRTFYPIDDKIIAAMDKTIPEPTEKFSPWLFLYEGTARARLPDRGEDLKLKQKISEHRHAAYIKYVQDRPQRFAFIDRKYKVGNDIKTITFVFAGNKIYFSGDELNSKFENFFLSEAIKRGYLGETEEAKESFLSRFRQLKGFITSSSTNTTLYLWQNGVKEPV